MICSTLPGVTQRTRGDHSTRVKNPNPGYQVPESHTKRLAFIRDLVEASQSRDVTRVDESALSISQLKYRGIRQKRFYADRVKAINALHAVFCEHVNLVTHDIEISIRNASDAAGLSTVSAAEQQRADDDPNYTPKVSTSRASRAFRDMVEMGWIYAESDWQVWDKEAGQWIDKVFQASELFFNVAGITSERVEKQQKSRLGYLKNKALRGGLSPEEVGRMSVTEIRQHRRHQWRRNAFERRSKEANRKKVYRALQDKERLEQRQLAQRRVLDALDTDALNISTSEFKELVNREIAMLRKFSGVTAPPH